MPTIISQHAASDFDQGPARLPSRPPLPASAKSQNHPNIGTSSIGATLNFSQRPKSQRSKIVEFCIKKSCRAQLRRVLNSNALAANDLANLQHRAPHPNIPDHWVPPVLEPVRRSRMRQFL
jgi:hypothetical protein